MHILHTIFCILALAIVAQGETLEIENGTSPNQKFSLRFPVTDDDRIPALQIYSIEESKVIFECATGGYRDYRSTVMDGSSTLVLWSPDSKHIAIMTRGTKRTTQVNVFSVNKNTVKEIDLPDGLQETLKLLNIKEIHRYVRQVPSKWIDNDTLVVLISADFLNPKNKDQQDECEAEVKYSIKSRQIISSKRISSN